MEKRYNYKLDKRSRRITSALMAIVVLVGVSLLFRFMNTGTYIPAWFLSIVIAVLALFVLSIPRFIRITDTDLEIHCFVELTRLPVGNIKGVKRIDNSSMRRCIPILGSYGFCGYYGYFFNLSEWEMVKVYASKWSDFIEIEDIYEQKYIVNCDQPDEFVKDLLARISAVK